MCGAQIRRTALVMPFTNSTRLADVLFNPCAVARNTCAASALITPAAWQRGASADSLLDKVIDAVAAPRAKHLVEVAA